MQFLLFTDDIRELSIREACRAAKKAGFDGLDLTLRPGGHVLPENAGKGLAEAHEIADEEGVTIGLITTVINSANSPHTEAIFQAAHYHIPAIKIGYWPYAPFGRLAKQLDDARAALEGIARLAARYHVKPCVHIHSGPILSNVPLLHHLLRDFSPKEVGAYVDPMHMTVEGGLSGWEIALDLVAPWVALVGAKNFIFQQTDRDRFGQQRYVMKKAPLADGMARYPQFFQRLKAMGYDGVVSLHSEYKGAGSWRQLSTPEIIEQAAADLRYLKRVIAEI